MTDLEGAVDRLNAVPLEDFVAERKRLAKELRAAGDRESAAELAKLPKPSAPAWALNQLAREQPHVMTDWLDAAEALRDASSSAGRGSGDALRAAMAAHREATRGLLARVREEARPNGRELSEPMLDRVRELLQAATADPARAELLRAGRASEAGEDDEPPPLPEPAAGGRTSRTGAGGRGSRAGAGGRGAGGRGSKAGAGGRGSKDRAGGRDSKARAAEERAERQREEREAAARAELERLVVAAEERLAELREAAAERAAAAEAAAERLEEARRTLHRSESEDAAAREAAEEAEEAAAQAERELRTLNAKLSS